MSGHVLAIDQGTTSSRAIVFDGDCSVVAIDQREIAQIYPASGWVEHDPMEIWSSVTATMQAALDKSGISAAALAAIGITNQRETVVIWERATGRPVYNAIVWQDRRTADLCGELEQRGLEPLFAQRTGLLLDPYFSGTKLAWLLQNVPAARHLAADDNLCFGTVDSWLLWNLTDGAVHATDATNASRTLLFNIDEQVWDRELLEILGIPESILPEVRDCADTFGTVAAFRPGAGVPITGMAGDQQAATIGNACLEPGMLKATYGTGCFMLLNTGNTRVASRHRLLTTVASRLNGATTYALEGSIFSAGAAVQWLRDGLGLISDAAETGAMAERADPKRTVFLVPAFTGLGAPHWDPAARGAMYGITRDTGPNEIASAVLESVALQTYDLFRAMQHDWVGDQELTVMRVDGGMVASDWTMQRLADFLEIAVDRPRILETTALGAAWLAGSKAGVWPDQAEFPKHWAMDRRFLPRMSHGERAFKLAGWRDAIFRTTGDSA